MASSDQDIFAGRCACGFIKYEIKLPEGMDVPKQSFCHCNYCKRVTGSCFSRTILVPLSSITVVSGEPKKFTQPKDTLRGIFRFCGDCGTQLYAEHDAFPGQVAVSVGSLDRQAEFTEMGLQMNCENESTWLKDALQKKEGRFLTFPPNSKWNR